MSADDEAAIKRALAGGQMSVLDPATGFQRAMFATCPHDGQSASIRRAIRGARGSIDQLTMRCPACGHEFTAPPAPILLQ